MTHYRNIVILTGAGVSAESGLDTFRGEEGLWTAELKLIRDSRTVAQRRTGIECRGVDRMRSHGYVRRSKVNPYRLAYDDGTPYYPVGIVKAANHLMLCRAELFPKLAQCLYESLRCRFQF